jgi:hypothetical protein
VEEWEPFDGRSVDFSQVCIALYCGLIFFPFFKAPSDIISSLDYIFSVFFCVDKMGYDLFGKGEWRIGG